MASQTKTFVYGGINSAASRYFRTELTLTEKTVNFEKNSTVLTYALVLYSGNTRLSQWRTGARIIINDKEYVHRDGTNYSNQITIGEKSSLTLCQGEITVPHNTDGTCDLSVSFSVYHPKTVSYTPGNFTYTGGSMTLTPIPRVNTVAATDAYIGAVSMVAISQKKSGYTHSLSFEIGSISGFLTPDGEITDQEQIFEELSLPFSIPESFYNAIPESPTGKCRLSCRTYEGANLVGISQTDFTVMTRPTDCAPSLTATVRDGNPSTVALTGNPSVLVRYASQADCTVIPIPQKGALPGQCFIENIPGETLSIENAEKDTYRFAVMDSRGYKTEKTVTVQQIPYVKLTVNAIAARPDPTNGQVTLSVWGNCYTRSFGKETNSISVSCALPDGREVELTPTFEGDTYRAEVLLEGLDHMVNHTLQITVADALMSVTATVPVQKGIPVFHWGENCFCVNVPSVISGVHMASATAGEDALCLQAPFGALVCGSGVLGVADMTGWQGTAGVTVTLRENGDLTIQLPADTGQVILLSPGEMTIRK